jgi:dihydrofolate reductase
MIDPVALASGTTIFAGIQRNLDLKLKKAKVFESGIVLLRYRPVKSG